MVLALIGIVIGLALGWFSYHQRSLFLGAIVPTLLFGIYFARPVLLTYILVHVPMFQEPIKDEDGQLPALTQWFMDSPHHMVLLACWILFAAILMQIACHVKVRCYTDPPPELTREQLRAKLYAEMKYSDDLLD
ncbi:MAG: hypothetical protein AAGJ85_08470 [Pseudomonadota bacterium]